MRPNPQFPADLVIFTEEILNGKLHFLCSGFAYFRISFCGTRLGYGEYYFLLFRSDSKIYGDSFADPLIL